MKSIIREPKSEIGYLAIRDNFLKHYLPIITQQKKQKYFLEPVIIFPSKTCSIFGNKNNTNALIEKSEIYGIHKSIKIYEINDEFDFLEIIKDQNIKVLVYITCILPENIMNYTLPLSKELGVKWCVLGHTGDELMCLDGSNCEIIKKWDLITTINYKWKSILKNYMANLNIDEINNANKIQCIGSPELDQINQFELNQNQIKIKYGLPMDKRIILVTTAPTYSIEPKFKYLHSCKFISLLLRLPPFIHIIKKIIKNDVNYMVTNFHSIKDYTTIFSLIKKFSDRSGSIIVLKRRAKDFKPKSWEVQFSDYIIEDSCFYPFNTIELLSVADLYIGFGSYTLIEAIASKVPSISLLCSLYKVESRNYMQKELWKMWAGHNPSFEIDGVSKIFNLFSSDGWHQFKKLMLDPSLLFKFNDLKCHQFLNNYLGNDQFNYSKRFSDAVERCFYEM